MKRIAFIIPYIGRFNNYFNLWLQSCRNNPTVDWYILTDNKENYDYPENVHKIETTMDELRERFNEALGFEVALDRPYKFCDMKPSYVYVFQDMVKDYDFCGWCDVDLIWGDIRSFLTDEVLENNDMISRWGHCTLIRNTKVIRELFMTNTPPVKRHDESFPSYKEAFTSNNIYIFDETPFLLYAMHAGLRIFNIESTHYDCSISHKYYQLAWHNKGYLPSLGYDTFYYDNGELYLLTTNGKEVEQVPLLYAHFQKRQMQNLVKEAGSYCITNDIFINRQKPSGADEIMRLSPRPIIDFTPQKRFLQRIKRKLLPRHGIRYYHWQSEIIRLKEKMWIERYCR